MCNKKIMVVAALVMGAFCMPATYANGHYGQDNGYYDYARVVEVKPVYRIVGVSTPQRECHEERVVYHGAGGHDSATPTIMGGLLGGVIGSRFGKGTGRDVATVAGVILGASLANDYRSRRNSAVPHAATQQVCSDVYHYSEREELDGYEVKYRYRGNSYTTRMDHHPGEKIRVHVQVTPLE